MKHFRPIAFCNVVYKLFSKVLVNRIEPLFAKCITEEQVSFVKVRLITNNAFLSPYLFILGMEGYSGLIKKVEDSGDLYGVRICKNTPSISHLKFVDDCFIFFRSTDKEAWGVKSI
uniref:Reverse transcriptase domain-containing protein n=1 Tax=Cajanus cajan TaxID=3821 RepID=A0A151RKF8_CAJCA|nr:hypothetical protein KK1_035536 [Cajanus cajan]